MKKLFLLFFTNLFLLSVFSQTLIIQIEHVSPLPLTYPCPNEVHGYKIKIVNDRDGYHYSSPWKITDGDIISGGGRNQDYCTIRWHDKTQGTITIDTVRITDGGYSWSAYNQQFAIPVRSLAGVTPSELSGNLSVLLKSTTPVTYTSSIIKYPTTNEEVISYSWTIPVNWVYNGITSDGTNVITTPTRYITITPDACSGGTVKVWATNEKCSTNLISSNSKSINIVRTWPNFEIEGSDILCTTGSYSISNLENGYNVTWNPSYQITRVSTQGSNPCTFSSSSYNIGTIGASINLSTCNTSKTFNPKTVRLNGPGFDDVYLDLLTSYGQNASYMCENTTYHIYAMNTGPCTTNNYTWNVPSGWTVFYTWNNMISVNTNSTPGGMVEVFANTCCGSNSKIKIGYLPSGYCGGYYMVISPNPAETYIELSFTETNDEEISKDKVKIKKNKDGELGSYTIQIIDKNGYKIKSINGNGFNTRIDVRELIPDTYFLHLITDKEVYKQQIIIN